MGPLISKDPAGEIPKTVSRILQEGSTAVLVTLIEAPGQINSVGRKILIGSSGEISGTLEANDKGVLDSAVSAQALRFLGSREETVVFEVKAFAPELNEWVEAKLLFERIQPEQRVVICGAGHVGASLANLANLLGYHVTLIDDRAEFVSRRHFPAERIKLVTAERWSEAVAVAVGNGRGVYVAIVTRGHSEDEECLRSVMGLKANYVGLIGSRRRVRIVLDRLREQGASDEDLSDVHAPVGLDIGAVTPEEVALAIMAEMVAVRRGGKGGSLSGKSPKSKV